jgi:tetratricopeptide (TPR) repeat protein
MNRKQLRSTRAQHKQKSVRLQGKPHTVEAAGELAFAKLKQGDFQAAEDMYHRILAVSPGHFASHNNLGVIQQETKRYDAALASYDRVIALNPLYGESYYNRGVVLQKMQRYEEALASYARAIALKPDYPTACNNRGNVLHTLKRYPEALASYESALELQPGFAEAHNNRGVTLQAMERHAEALASFDTAIACTPGFAEAYNNRGVTLQAIQRHAEALASFTQAIALRPGYTEAFNNRGITLQETGRYDEALAHYDAAIATNPAFAKAYANRGSTLQALHRYDEALASFDTALSLYPEFAEAYNNRAIVLQKMARFEEALASCDRAIALNPAFAKAYNNRAATLQKLKRFDDALASCDKAIALKPDYAVAYQSRGLLLVNKGDMAEAERMFLKALALKPEFPDPVFSLANIRKYKDASDTDIARINGLLRSTTISAQDREYLYFALGKIYDDCGLYDAAFASYRQANQLGSASVTYDATAATDVTRRIMEVFDTAFLSQPFAFARASRTPLFIVGMPRSGTTLMASALSNHPLIGTAGELLSINDFTLRLPTLLHGQMPYPQAVTHLTAEVATQMAEEYEQRLRRDIGPGTPHVIDKYPLNFRHLGLIRKLFPHAKVIHCRRNPLDTCLSNYFQRFSSHYDYAFDLRNIGHFYNAYIRLMAHWRQVLPDGMMLEVRYEDMVADTEQATRKALGFLGLDWDAACLTPHTNTAPIETASQWQVRQPIYTRSVERWRHYDKHLAPLREILGV